MLLSHADRSRFVAETHRAPVSAAGRAPLHGTVLHDGVVLGSWRLDQRDTGGATLVVRHVDRLTKRATAAIAAEGRRFLRFLASDADSHDVRLVAVD